MLDSALLINTVNKILSNSIIIQELELEHREHNNPPIRLFDFHDVFLVIFTLLLTTMKYSLIGLIVTFIIYEIVCYFVNGEFFPNWNMLKLL